MVTIQLPRVFQVCTSVGSYESGSEAYVHMYKQKAEAYIGKRRLFYRQGWGQTTLTTV